MNRAGRQTGSLFEITGRLTGRSAQHHRVPRANHVDDRPNQGALAAAGAAQDQRQLVGQSQFHRRPLLLAEGDAVDGQVFRDGHSRKRGLPQNGDQLLGSVFLITPRPIYIEVRALGMNVPQSDLLGQISLEGRVGETSLPLFAAVVKNILRNIGVAIQAMVFHRTQHIAAVNILTI